MANFLIRLSTDETDMDVCLSKPTQDVQQILRAMEHQSIIEGDTDDILNDIYEFAQVAIDEISAGSFEKQMGSTLFIVILVSAMRIISDESREAIVEAVAKDEEAELHCLLDSKENRVNWRLYIEELLH